MKGTMSVSFDKSADLLITCYIIGGVSIGITILGIQVESANDASFNASYDDDNDGAISEWIFDFDVG